MSETNGELRRETRRNFLNKVEQQETGMSKYNINFPMYLYSNPRSYHTVRKTHHVLLICHRGNVDLTVMMGDINHTVVILNSAKKYYRRILAHGWIENKNSNALLLSRSQTLC